MSEGDTCNALCASGRVAVGNFTCLSGVLRKTSVCVPGGSYVTSTTDIIVGTLRLQMSACPPTAVLESAMVTSLSIQQANLLWVACSVNSGARRLQATAAYNIDYEIKTTAATSAATVQGLQNLTTTSSSQQTAFNQAFTNAGQTAPTSISTSISPTLVQNVPVVADASGNTLGRSWTEPAVVVTDESDDNELVAGLVIGAAALVGCICCGIFLVMQRKERGGDAGEQEEGRGMA